MRHGRADSGVEADSAHQSAPESGTTRVRLGQLECTTRTPSHARSCPTRIPRVRLGRRVGHDACTTRIPRIRLGRRVAHRVVQLGIRVGTRRSDSAVRVGGPAARLGAREGPRVGTKESDSGPARGPESDRVCTVRSQVPVATLPIPGAANRFRASRGQRKRCADNHAGCSSPHLESPSALFLGQASLFQSASVRGTSPMLSVVLMLACLSCTTVVRCFQRHASTWRCCSMALARLA